MTANGKNKELESDFQKNAEEFIRSKGGYVVKVHVSAYQNQGTPDILVCYRGFFIGFELKVDGNTLSALQKLRIRQIQNAGGIAKGIYSLEEIEETLYEIQRLQPGGKSS
jgi:hypothetical protein